MHDNQKLKIYAKMCPKLWIPDTLEIIPVINLPPPYQFRDRQGETDDVLAGVFLESLITSVSMAFHCIVI